MSEHIFDQALQKYTRNQCEQPLRHPRTIPLYKPSCPNCTSSFMQCREIRKYFAFYNIRVACYPVYIGSSLRKLIFFDQIKKIHRFIMLSVTNSTRIDKRLYSSDPLLNGSTNVNKDVETSKYKRAMGTLFFDRNKPRHAGTPATMRKTSKRNQYSEKTFSASKKRSET